MIEQEQIRTDIKRQLNSYRELREEHNQLADELARLEALMRTPSGPNLDGVPRGSDISKPVERFVVKYMDLERKYRAQINNLLAGQAKIEDIIEALEPTERRLARYRYIDGLSWENVCEKMNYSWRQTHRIHSAMLDKLVDAELEKRGQAPREEVLT